ncbi:MAG: hypothetical protein SFZ03_02290 [Candidatus Melainabacteria bacterium]|nr:hypothetical protein [Candidatus Melainabacteria bacterium]
MTWWKARSQSSRTLEQERAMAQQLLAIQQELQSIRQFLQCLPGLFPAQTSRPQPIPSSPPLAVRPGHFYSQNREAGAAHALDNPFVLHPSVWELPQARAWVDP